MTGLLTNADTQAPTSTETARDAPERDEARRRVRGVRSLGGYAGARAAWLTGLALLAVTAFGAFLRFHGLSDVGLWRDDAWVALSAKFGLGSAWHMFDTAPGSFLIVRTVLVLGPGSALAAQLPAYVAGIAAIPVVYLLVRWFRLGRFTALLSAVFICVTPVGVMYSSRVKEYELDILLACLVLALGEWARRTPGRRPLRILAAASVLAFFCSASLGPVVAGVWVALAVFAWRDHIPSRRRDVLIAAGYTVIGCLVIAALFYARVSPKNQVIWSAYFIRHGSLSDFLSSLVSTSWHLFAVPLFLKPTSGLIDLVLLTMWLAIMVVGVRGNRAMAAPAWTLGFAYLLSALRIAPLGTGRTDLYLYPALILLTAAGVRRIVVKFTPAVSRLSAFGQRTVKVLGVGVVLVGVGFGATLSAVNRPVYPAVNVSSLAVQIHREEHPGDLIFVAELMRYSWAFMEEPTPVLRVGRDWAAGFTVVSTDPSVFIAPSEYYEGDSHPKRWAAAVASAGRIWYVWSPPLRLNPSYRALRLDGWHPVKTLRVTGAVATLLERSSARSAVRHS